MSSELLAPPGKSSRLPRTELWVAGRVFRGLGLADDAAGHIALARRLSWDYLFLPAGGSERPAAGWNYRRFSPQEVSTAAAVMPAGVILDGVFGGLVSRKGLPAALLEWEDAGTEAQLAEEAARAAAVLAAYLAVPLKAVVIADDIAYQQGTYLSPAALRRRLFPLYQPLVAAAHAAGAEALFHSDGRLSKVMADIRSAGFDGIACQVDCNRDALTEMAGWLVMGGIEAPMLNQEISETARRGFLAQVDELRRHCRLVVCSSAGISSLAELQRLEVLDRWLEGGG